MRILKTEVQGLHEDETDTRDRHTSRCPGRVPVPAGAPPRPAVAPRRRKRRSTRCSSSPTCSRRSTSDTAPANRGLRPSPAAQLEPAPPREADHGAKPSLSRVPASWASVTCSSQRRAEPRWPDAAHGSPPRAAQPRRQDGCWRSSSAAWSSGWSFHDRIWNFLTRPYCARRRLQTGHLGHSAHRQRRDGRLLPAHQGRRHHRRSSSRARSGCTRSGRSSLPGCTPGRSAGPTCSWAPRCRCSAWACYFAFLAMSRGLRFSRDGARRASRALSPRDTYLGYFQR